MKTSQPPTQPAAPGATPGALRAWHLAWWHDVPLTCHRCGCVFQIAPGDLVRVTPKRHPAPAIVPAPCPHCGATAATCRPNETAQFRPRDPRQVRPQ